MKGNKIQSRDRRSSRVQITAQDGTQQETRDTGRDEVTLNKGKTLPYIQKRGGDNVGQVKLIRALWTHVYRCIKSLTLMFRSNLQWTNLLTT